LKDVLSSVVFFLELVEVFSTLVDVINESSIL
jgi:uncharacterized membrane protein (DUF373 family)